MSPSKQKSKNTISPQEYDVLCGKISTSKHPGNLYFRELVLSRIDDYMAVTRKASKGQIVADIMNTLARNGARFLKVDSSSGIWSVIPAADAREKVSHAIRDRVNERKKGKIVLPQMRILESAQRKIPKRMTKKKIAGKDESKGVVACNPTCAKQSTRHKVLGTSINVVRLKSYQVKSSTPMTEIPEGMNEQQSKTRLEDLSLHQSLSQSLSLLNSTQENTFPQNHHGNEVPFDLIRSSPNMQMSSHASKQYNTYLSRTPILVDLDDDDDFSNVFEGDQIYNEVSHEEANEMSCDSSSSSGGAFLDDYNDLFIHDMPSQEEDSDFLLSLLREACTSIYT